MAKRVFIAVGTTAVTGLEALIERYKEEGLVKVLPNDVFIGLDSDTGALERFQMMLPTADRRVFGIPVQLTDTDASADLARQFQGRWKGLGIAGLGVGGDRRKSATALSWRTDRGILEKNIEAGSQVILVGSAFGGTSTGSFWHVAASIREILNRKRGAGNPSNDFVALLVLPEPNPQGPYVAGENLVGFLQDMQTVAWTRHLERDESLPFAVPAFWEFEPKEAADLPTRDPAKYLSQISNMYADRIFVLPTPIEGQHAVPVLIAEQAFLLGTLGLWHSLEYGAKLINEASASCHNPFAVVSMVHTRVPVDRLVEEAVWNALAKQWQLFRDGPGTADCQDLVSGIMRHLIESAGESVRKTQIVVDARRPVGTVLGKELKTLQAELPAALDAFRANVAHDGGWEWPKLRQLLPVIGDAAAAGAATGYEPGEVGNMVARLVARDIILAWNAYGQWVRGTAAKAAARRAAMLEFVRVAMETGEARERSLWAKAMRGGRAAAEEVVSRVRDALGRQLDLYQESCRCEGTHNHVTILEAEPATMLPRHLPGSAFVDSVVDEQTTAGTRGARARFVWIPPVPENDELRAFIQSRELKQLLLELLLKEDEPAVKRAAGKRVPEIARTAQLQMASRLGDNDPLRRIPPSLDTPAEIEASAWNFHEDRLHDYYRAFVLASTDGVSTSCARITDQFRLWSFLKPGGQHERDPGHLLALPTPVPDTPHCIAHAPDHGIRGIWMGESAMMLSIADVIGRLYRPDRRDDWDHKAMVAEEAKGSRRLLPLRDAILLGTVLGAIGVRLEADGRKACGGTIGDVPVTGVEIARGSGPLALARPNRKLSQLLDGTRLARVPVAWIAPLLEWIRTPEFLKELLPEAQDAYTLGEVRLSDRTVARNVRMWAEPTNVPWAPPDVLSQQIASGDYRHTTTYLEALSRALQERISVTF